MSDVLTLSYPEALPLQVISGIRHSIITKWPVLAGLGEEGLRKRDGQIHLVNPFPPRVRGSPLTSKVVWR